MFARVISIAIVLLCCLPSMAQTKPNYPPTMDGAITKVYKTIGDTKLNIYIYQPKSHEGNESRPAIVFFFGGGWKGGTPEQFRQHCKYLASRGMIAMSAAYRVRSRQEALAKDCVADAKSAIRWIRKNARELGVDADRIVAGGGSAGGHLAACTATIAGLEEGENLKVSSKPNGLALFNPAVALESIEGVFEISQEKTRELTERLGQRPKQLSPYHQLVKRQLKLPPTILFHGRDDKTVPFSTAEAFHKKATELGALAYLDAYEGQGHGFFNFGRDENKMYLSTMLKLDQFLVDHGLLEGPSPKEVKTFD